MMLLYSCALVRAEDFDLSIGAPTMSLEYNAVNNDYQHLALY